MLEQLQLRSNTRRARCPAEHRRPRSGIGKTSVTSTKPSCNRGHHCHDLSRNPRRQQGRTLHRTPGTGCEHTKPGPCMRRFGKHHKGPGVFADYELRSLHVVVKKRMNSVTANPPSAVNTTLVERHTTHPNQETQVFARFTPPSHTRAANTTHRDRSAGGRGESPGCPERTAAQVASHEFERIRRASKPGSRRRAAEAAPPEPSPGRRLRRTACRTALPAQRSRDRLPGATTGTADARTQGKKGGLPALPCPFRARPGSHLGSGPRKRLRSGRGRTALTAFGRTNRSSVRSVTRAFRGPPSRSST